MPRRCEICGVGIGAGRTVSTEELPDRTHHFCCEACRRTFHEHPDLFDVSPGLGVSAVQAVPGD